MLVVQLVTFWLALVSSIRVPTSWDDLNKFRTVQLQGSETSSFRNLRPYGVPYKVNNRYHDNKRHRDLKYRKNLEPASTNFNNWVPVVPNQHQQQLSPIFPNHRYQPLPPITRKNYRDDSTHEKDENEPEIDENEPEIERNVEEPSSDHEIPAEIPTKPIYPGQGQWAIKGKTHRPFISKHQFSQLKNDENEENIKPEGFEVFQQNRNLFNQQYDNFDSNLNSLPNNHKLGSFVEPSIKENDEEIDEESEDEENSEEFTPVKIYTQVRRSENEEHLPVREAEDPRLREVVKDSKIQTVYTEEGYEDEAYDHEGHEKNAEQSEGSAEFDKDVEKEPKTHEDAEAAGSEYEFEGRPKPTPKMRMTMNNLITTKEVKTTEVKDKGKQLEISSEIKVVSTPNNGTKAHRYIKIFPKIYRYDRIETTTGPSYEGLEDFGSGEKSEEKANVTEVDGGAEPVKNETEIADSIEPLESMTITKFHKRFKRFTPDLKVDTEFVSKIAEENAKPLPKIREIKTKPKYPYYNDKKINPLSPLRYSEDLENVPKKELDDLAFYNQASSKVECQEVESEVDPIPERVKNADKNPEEMEETTDVQELVKGPRLGNLGDKIDCFKLKYWGEDPLDNPIFKEKDVEPVLPLFGLPKRFKNEVGTTTNSPEIENEIELGLDRSENKNISFDSIMKANKTDREIKSTTEMGKSAETNPTTEIPIISIITTPKYTIDLKPKHIYDQIQLLDHLPALNFTSFNAENSSATDFGNSTRNGKNLEETAMLQAESANSKTQEISQDPPESQALQMRKRRRRPVRRPHPFRNIFDVNQFMPSPQQNRPKFRNYYQKPRENFDGIVVPRRKVLSEVHYKDEINPDEQLNVFADVINNIKNSSKDLKVASSSGLNQYNLRAPQRAVHIKAHSLDNIEESNSFYLTTSTTTIRPIPENSDQVYDDLRDQYDNLEILRLGATHKPRKRPTTTTEPYEDHVGDATSLEDEENPEEEEEKVPLGLSPPGLSHNYKTIYNPVVRAEDRFKTINHFLVEGMKPPSSKQKIYLYSDFKIPGIKLVRRRYRRSPARSTGYSEVVRNRNKPIDSQDDQDVVVEDEEDDYVPHRPKNYHYDEKTGRIVYDNPPESPPDKKPEDEDEEVEYIEVTDAPIPKPSRRNQATTPKWIIDPNTPSYVDYLKKVKENPDYVHIPDPTTTTTEKDETPLTTTTPKSVISTNPPEFLNILSKVRTDPSYKHVEDEKEKKRTTTTTEESLEEPEEVIEETREETQQNSPGVQNLPSSFQIFDISEYLPKVKTYSPRTSIDYSKYKTIERPNVRHNLSSRYSEDDALEDVNTMRVPILSSSTAPEINPEMSESKVEENESEVEETSTTTKEPSTTTKRIRTRTRGRVRPSTTKRPSSTTHSRRRTTTTSTPKSEENDEGVEEFTPASHDKAKRVFPRRQPTRIKIRTTTTPLPVGEENEDTTKIVRRRSQTSSNVPAQKIQPRIVVPDNNQKNEETVPSKEDRPGRITPRRVDSDVDVFQKYDKTKKHGGNYKRKEQDEDNEEDGDKSEETKDPEGEESGNKEVKRLTDVVPKPFAFYTDPKLPKNVNQLIETTSAPLRIDLNEEEPTNSGEEESEPDYDQEGNEEDGSESSEEKKSAPKKPVFIKDPSKRLYYYAPI